MKPDWSYLYSCARKCLPPPAYHNSCPNVIMYSEEKNAPQKECSSKIALVCQI